MSTLFLVRFFPPAIKGVKPPHIDYYSGEPVDSAEVVTQVMAAKLHKELLLPNGGGQFYFGLEKNFNPTILGGKVTWWGTEKECSGPLETFLFEQLENFFPAAEMTPEAALT